MFVDSQAPGRTHDKIACQNLLALFKKNKWDKALTIDGVRTWLFFKKI